MLNRIIDNIKNIELLITPIILFFLISSSFVKGIFSLITGAWLYIQKILIKFKIIEFITFKLVVLDNIIINVIIIIVATKHLT